MEEQTDMRAAAREAILASLDGVPAMTDMVVTNVIRTRMSTEFADVKPSSDIAGTVAAGVERAITPVVVGYAVVAAEILSLLVEETGRDPREILLSLPNLPDETSGLG